MSGKPSCQACGETVQLDGPWGGTTWFCNTCGKSLDERGVPWTRVRRQAELEKRRRDAQDDDPRDKRPTR